jgi:Second Messenger Oligonucleotide or Dinucleotide Synthetase domain
MSYAVAASFETFRSNIELTSDHRDTAASRRDHLVSLLKNDFEILEAFPSGSIPKYTAVKGYADLDVIVVLHYSKHIKGKKPSQVLKAVRDYLGEHRTKVRRNGQAVTLYYETWPNVDIVPVSRTLDDGKNVSHYNIPDMNREEWIRSRPKKHDQDMSDANASCGPNFKRIVKMIKWWNHQHSSLLQSFHIEVLALKTFNNRMLSDYSWDVFSFFDKACNLTDSYLTHEGDIVDTYLDWKKRPEVVKRLETARDKARSAWHATYGSNNDHKKAIRLWGQIFGDKFPAYG